VIPVEMRCYGKALILLKKQKSLFVDDFMEMRILLDQQLEKAFRSE